MLIHSSDCSTWLVVGMVYQLVWAANYGRLTSFRPPKNYDLASPNPNY